MELRHLRYFVAVAETCHFGQAAQRLHMAQAAVSQAIRQLESQLGAPLLTRTTRHVSLTPAGEFLLDEARRILDAVDASAVGVRRVADGHRGLVRIGFTPTAVFTHLPPIAQALERSLPEVALEVQADLLTPQLRTMLHEGTLDVAVLRPPAAGDDIAVRAIESEPLIVALPAEHRLAAEPEIGMLDLRSEGFVLFEAGDSAVNEAVLRACRDAGFTPRRDHVAPNTAVMLALVAAGLGIALVPGSARSIQLAGVQFRDVADAGSIEIALAWREHPSALVESVIGVLTDAGLFATGAPIPAEEVR